MKATWFVWDREESEWTWEWKGGECIVPLMSSAVRVLPIPTSVWERVAIPCQLISFPEPKQPQQHGMSWKWNPAKETMPEVEVLAGMGGNERASERSVREVMAARGPTNARIPSNSSRFPERVDVITIERELVNSRLREFHLDSLPPPKQHAKGSEPARLREVSWVNRLSEVARSRAPIIPTSLSRRRWKSTAGQFYSHSQRRETDLGSPVIGGSEVHSKRWLQMTGQGNCLEERKLLSSIVEDWENSGLTSKVQKCDFLKVAQGCGEGWHTFPSQLII